MRMGVLCGFHSEHCSSIKENCAYKMYIEMLCHPTKLNMTKIVNRIYVPIGCTCTYVYDGIFEHLSVSMPVLMHAELSVYIFIFKFIG